MLLDKFISDQAIFSGLGDNLKEKNLLIMNNLILDVQS